MLANQQLSQYQLNRNRGGVIPFLGIARLTSGNNILWCMFATLAYRYDMVFRETLKLLGAISTPISVCCLDIIPLFKRQSIDGEIEQRAPFGTLSVMQKCHSILVGFFPFLSYSSFMRRITSIPIPIHCQLMFSVSRITLTMLRQYRIMVFGVICRAVFATMLSHPFTMSGRIKDPLVASVAIAFRGVGFLFGASRAYYDSHYSIISQEG